MHNKKYSVLKEIKKWNNYIKLFEQQRTHVIISCRINTVCVKLCYIEGHGKSGPGKSGDYCSMRETMWQFLGISISSWYKYQSITPLYKAWYKTIQLIHSIPSCYIHTTKRWPRRAQVENSWRTCWTLNCKVELYSTVQVIIEKSQEFLISIALTWWTDSYSGYVLLRDG